MNVTPRSFPPYFPYGGGESKILGEPESTGSDRGGSSLGKFLKMFGQNLHFDSF